MDMEPSKVQEMEKDRENDQEIVPEPMKLEESEEKPNATRLSALDMILESLWKIRVFLSDFLVVFSQETHHNFTEDGEYVVPPLRQLREFLLNNLSVTHPLEANGVSDFLVTILELLPRRRSGNGEEESLNSHFEVYEVAKMICNRCKMISEYPVEHSYGLVMIANSLRETKYAFEDFTFENILKVIKIKLKMPCNNEGCGKLSYVQRMINTLPSVFTIGLEWENNETEEEIYETISVLATEIDISAIYKYEGDCPFTKYHLVSMVCLCGDQYNCVAYENKRWVRYFGSEREVIGDWESVLDILVKLNMLPQILFFESVRSKDQSDQIVSGTYGKRAKDQSDQIVFGTYGQRAKDQ